jgi:uncharacterized protein (TIGR02646 family)
MHALDRNAVPIPACLVAPPAGWDYSDLRGNEREEIRTRLLELQTHRCAYCERRTGDERDDGHIEHFRNQVEHIRLRLSWANMFSSTRHRTIRTTSSCLLLTEQFDPETDWMR